MKTLLPCRLHALKQLAGVFLPGALGCDLRRTALAVVGLGLLAAIPCSVSAANLTWAGTVNNNWDTTTLNWLNGGVSSTFHSGDNVTFDDSSTTANVSLISAMSPGSVTVSASVINYSLGGSGGIVGTGGLTKSGTGQLSLTATNGYTGNTTVSAGTLALSGSGSILTSPVISLTSGTTLDAQGRSDGTLTLNSGQALTGVGTILGTVKVAGGATLAPGTSSTGTLTLNSNLTLAGNVIIKIDGSTFQNDLITGINTLTYGGTLTISNLGGALAAGDSFTLFNFHSSSSNFTSVVGSPGAGLVYSFSPASGVLSVSNAPAATPAANIYVNATQPSLLTVHFDQAVDPASAGNVSNYTLYVKSTSTVVVSITNAIVQSDNQTVALYLNNSAGEFFAVSASNIATNSSGSNVTFNATGYLGDFTNSAIGDSSDPNPSGQVLSIFNDTYYVTSGGSDIGGTNDHCQFVYRQVVGDFDVSTSVTNIQATDPGSKAGLMAREFLTENSRAISTFFTALNFGTNQIQMTERSVSNSAAFNIASPIPSSSFGWLRISRAGNVFTTFYGSDGLNWTTSSIVALTLNTNLYVGLAGTSHINGETSTAAFTGFGVSGAHPGDNVLPTLSAYTYLKTNLVAHWQRTPRDYAIEVGNTLLKNTNSVGSISNATQWAFLMLPIFDTALTGTNPASPAPGRYMVIPMNLFTNPMQFIRLAQVDRVIPDPSGVTPGVIFSQASGSLKSAPAGLSSLCSAQVISTTAVASTNVPVLCPASPAGKYSYQFTTLPSGSTYQTVISVRNFPVIGISNCDTAYSAGSGKAQVTLTPASPNSGYTFVAAAQQTPPLNCPIKVQVNIFTNF